MGSRDRGVDLDQRGRATSKSGFAPAGLGALSALAAEIETMTALIRERYVKV